MCLFTKNINNPLKGDDLLKTIFSGIWEYLKNTNKLFWLLTIAASCYGCLLIASVQRSTNYNYLKTQIIAISLGYIGAIILSVMDYKTISKMWYVVGGVALFLTMLVFLVGIQVEGTDDKAWLRLPGGFTFQPSELSKICFIITFSYHLSYLVEKGKIKKFTSILGLIAHLAIPVVLIHLQGDDGAVLIFAFMALVMAFLAGVALRYFFALILAVGCAAPIVWTYILNDDHRGRILALFDLDKNASNPFVWQQYQGKISIATGQLDGYGLFKGPRVSSQIVPYQENDFILSVAGEELGFIGCLLLLAILLLIMLRTLTIASNTADALGKFICYGFFALIMVQTCLNVGMVLGFLPVIGVTLPFFSAGGTSAMCLYFGVGLVQSVYMHRNDPDKLNYRSEYYPTL